MITAATRLEWRRIFAESTSAPWAENPIGSAKLTTMQGAPVATYLNRWDASFGAAARSGWPQALDALETAERGRDEATRRAERMEMAVAEAARITAELVDKAEQLAEVARIYESAEKAGRLALEKEIRLNGDLSARLQFLESALDNWRKHRHSPTLVQALDNYDRMPK